MVSKFSNINVSSGLVIECARLLVARGEIPPFELRSLELDMNGTYICNEYGVISNRPTFFADLGLRVAEEIVRIGINKSKIKREKRKKEIKELVNMPKKEAIGRVQKNKMQS